MALRDRNEKRVEFGRRGDAGELRDELPDDALLDSDDGREKTLRIDKSELSREQIQRVEGEAAISRDDARGDMHGQASLSDAEKKRLDFTRTTVPEARTAKASLLAEGVSDWTAYFDPTLTTSEMADKARSTQASGGERLDSADTQRARDRQGAQMQREVKGKQAKRAREGCKDGFEEACDQLVEKHGVSRAEAERLLGGGPMQGSRVTADGGLVDTTVLRASAPGTFLQQPPEPSPDAPGYRNGSTGRFVGYEITEYDDAKRSPETGRIKTLGDADPVPRDEAIDRWGRPDGIDGNPRDDDAMRDALFKFEPMSREDEITAQARAADVSLAPDEVINDTGRVGTTALGGNVLGEGERRATELEDDRPPEQALREQSRSMGGGSGNGRIELFEAAPDELPGGFEFAGGQTRGSGDVREARFIADTDVPGADKQVLEAQEIDGSFSLYGGFEGPEFGEDDLNPVYAVEQGDNPQDIFESAETYAEQQANRNEQQTTPDASLGPTGPLASEQRRSEAADTGGRIMTDDRDQQGTLDVGMGAGVTEDRSGQIAGSANFADERDELMPDQDVGEQAGLLEQQTNVGGDGQTDLFGGNASETSGAEYRL
jgi:hypothetical protein